MSSSNTPEGVVNVLKPPGMTSSNVVVDVRRLFHVKRVGHTGTLDPGAAGVLPICVGRATRLFDLLVDKEKEYIAELAFGARTDTQDSYGTVIETSAADVSAEALAAVLPEFLGEQSQIPPMYSALKRDGKALYQLAREGQEIAREARRVQIHALELIERTGEGRFLIRMRCSRGTYVRTLCEDIGTRLGLCAHMAFLLRSASGPFRVEDAYSIAELAALDEAGRLHEALLPVERALDFLPSLSLPAEEAFSRRLKNGVPIEAAEWPLPWEDGLYRLYDSVFLGVGECRDAKLRLKLHLYED